MTAVFDLAGADPVDHPFPHVRFAEYAGLSQADLAALVDAFPRDLPTMESDRRIGSDKCYLTQTVTVYDRCRWTAARAVLDPVLRQFLEVLVDSDYRYRLCQVLGLPQRSVRLEVRLSAYPRYGWMSRHTDRPDKLFSQNIYLCPGWSTHWGGGLALYESQRSAEPATVFMPGAGNSLAFVRSSASWHEVQPVAPSARFPRRTVLIHGYGRPAEVT